LLLDEAGWRPESLARRVNAALEQHPHKRRVHEKTPYRWLRGEIPHPPVPDIVVELLSSALGSPVRFDMVWPDTARRPSPQEGGEDLGVPWNHTGLLKLLKEWRMLTRRTFLTLSGAALTGPAWQSLDTACPIPAVTGKGGRVSPSVVSLIEAMVAGAQQLDERHGSAAADFVADQFSSVSHLVESSSYDAETGQRLCAALAQLAQTSGWMAQESAHDALAQRWYDLGLRNAHSAGDRGLSASIMALMSNQATTLGKNSDALQLAAAAEQAAAHAPAKVQALIAARSTLAHAGAGDLAGVQRARDRAIALINDAGQDPDRSPAWAGYVTRTELDAISGRALVMLARYLPSRRRNRLICDAGTLLRGRALDTSEAHQRSAVRHGAWLSLAYVRTGDLDQAVDTAYLALQRLPAVTSVRCATLFAELRTELAPHAHRAPQVRNLINEVDQQVPRR
jgi:hypothetical protein